MLQMLGLIEEMPERSSHKIKEEIRKVVRGIRQQQDGMNDTPQIVKKDSSP